MFIFSLIQAANTENDILVLGSENSNWCTDLWKRFAFVVVWIGEVVILCFLVLLIQNKYGICCQSEYRQIFSIHDTITIVSWI